LQHKPQDGGPPIEDPIPVDLDSELGMPFDFFGLGQPINGPVVLDEQNQGQQ